MDFPADFPSTPWIQRGVRSPRRGTAAGVLWDAAGGAFFFLSEGAADFFTSNVQDVMMVL